MSVAAMQFTADVSSIEVAHVDIAGVDVRAVPCEADEGHQKLANHERSADDGASKKQGFHSRASFSDTPADELPRQTGRWARETWSICPNLVRRDRETIGS